MSIKTRFSNAWNAFMNKDPTGFTGSTYVSGGSTTDRSKYRASRGTEKTIVNSVINRIALDVASIQLVHIYMDENKRFESEVDSGLNSCFNLSANIDQTGRSFLQDAAFSLLDEGHIAIVPTDTSADIRINDSYDIFTMRVGKVVEWYPQSVKVNIYNDRTGKHQDILLPKTSVAIIENPFYSIMNQTNSTMQRLKRKLALMDMVDDKNTSGKLDLIIQLPYLAKSPKRKEQAINRKNEITDQLTGSQYGIAYIDGTEKVIQLNRSIESNFMPQIEFLQNQFLTQLGMSNEILNGTADEATMNNYYNRIVEPILSAFSDEMKRKFLTKTARTQRQSISFFRDPFKLVPVAQLAELADKLTRNEILTSNEVRQIIGMKPSKDPAADQLRNKNLSQSNEEVSQKQMVDVNGNPIGEPNLEQEENGQNE